MTEQNTDFALSPDGTSTAPPQADDPRYTPGLEDETKDSKESKKGSRKGPQEREEQQREQQQSGGVQGQAGEHGGVTNADADASDPNKTVKADGPVVTPGTTDTSKTGGDKKASTPKK